jgi:hypothetical protein
MGSGREEFVSFINAESNPDSDTDTIAYSDAESHFVSDSQTNQPVYEHDLQRRHKPDSYGVGVKRSGDKT